MLVLPLTIALLTFPGLPFAIWAVRRTEISPWVVVAAIPGASIAVNFTAVWAWPGSQISRVGVLVYLVVAVAASIAVALPALFGLGDIDRFAFVPPRDKWPIAAASAALLIASFAVGGWAWSSGMGTLSQPPPNYDAAQHGFMTAHIVESGGVAVEDVLVTGPDGLSDHGKYYPYGTHATTALVATASGNSIARSLNALLVVLAAIALPLGAFAFMREVLPDFPLAAPVAALAVTAVESFPYKPISWGGIPLIAGMTLMLGAGAAFISLARRAPRSWVGAAFVALAIVGVFHAHNSEAVIAIVLAVLALAADRLTTPEGAIVPTPWLRSSAMAVFRVGLISFALILPVFTAVIGGGDERSTFDDTALGEPFASLGQILFMTAGTYRNGLMLLLAVVGLAAMVRYRRYSIPIAFVAVVVGAYFTATTDHRLSRALTFPWWRQAERMIYLLALLAALAVGALVGIAAQSAAHSARRSFRNRPSTVYVAPAVAIVMTLIAAPALLIDGARAGRTLVFNSYEFYSPVSSDSIAAFAVLRDIAGSDGSVLSEYNRDGSMWMYAYSRAQPLYGINLPNPEVDRSWLERSSLAGTIGQLGTNPEVDRIVRKYRVRAVYFDDRTFAGSRHDWTLEQLRSIPALEEVFTQGSVSVFAVRLDD